MSIFKNEFISGFPNHIKKDVKKVLRVLGMRKFLHNYTTSGTVNYILKNENIIFPERIYYLDVSDKIISKLSENQQNVLHCIYTRNCDGYVREKHLSKLLNSDYPDWAIPYIVRINSEYVIQILELTYSILKDKNTDNIKQFCLENQIVFCKDYSRMVSYWNEFYRYNHYHFKNYIGRRLFRECFGYSRSMEKNKR